MSPSFKKVKNPRVQRSSVEALKCLVKLPKKNRRKINSELLFLKRMSSSLTKSSEDIKKQSEI